VTIVACTLNKFYASEPFDAATSTAQTDLTQAIRYVIFNGQFEEHTIGFSDYDPSLTPDCEALYEKSCKTTTPLPFIAEVTPEKVVVSTVDNSLDGSHVITIQCTIENMQVPLKAETEVVFNLEIVGEPCFGKVLTPHDLPFSPIAYLMYG